MADATHIRLVITHSNHVRLTSMHEAVRPNVDKKAVVKYLQLLIGIIPILKIRISSIHTVT